MVNNVVTRSKTITTDICTSFEKGAFSEKDHIDYFIFVLHTLSLVYVKEDSLLTPQNLVKGWLEHVC